jgi:hypothetical protein
MFLLRRIIVAVSAILGAFAGMVLLALINAAFNLDLTFSQVSVYGIIAGIGLGIVMGYYIMFLLAKRARRFITNKLSYILGKVAGIKRM